MLTELHIRDLGVIARADVEFGPGLNVVTGETGAGKTLLVGSLALVTGARARTKLVAAGSDEASVEAVFTPPASARAALAAFGVETGEDVVLARRIASDGKSRAWLNGRLVPASAGAEAGAALVEVHGQGAGFQLARPAAQLAAIDALAGTEGLLAEYRRELARLRALEAERERLRADELVRVREAELLAFQADEIDRAELQPGEDERIAAELSRLQHAERLRSVATQTIGLAGAEGAAGELAEASKLAASAADADARAAGFASRLASASAEAQEVVREIRAWMEDLHAEPGRLAALQERKALIGALKRKYGADADEILRAGAEARARLAQLEGASERSAAIDAEVDAARTVVERLASQLSDERTAAARKMAKLVRAELPALALAGATFDVRIEPSEPTEDGADRVAFLFAESKRREPDEIGKVASGGELSRAMVAVTLALARTHAVPVLVFDEADQGVGGEAALDVARRLARLGRTHQVLVVSHLPQIAAFADRHIVVRKGSGGVEVEPVDEGSRIAEISRMLAGLGSSELAQGHAAELVGLAEAEATSGARSAAPSV